MRVIFALLLTTILIGCSNTNEDPKAIINTPGYTDGAEESSDQSDVSQGQNQPSTPAPEPSQGQDQVDNVVPDNVVPDTDVVEKPEEVEASAPTLVATHEVCAFNDDDQLKRNLPIHQASDIVFVDSMSDILDDITEVQEQWPETSDLEVLLMRLDILSGNLMLALTSLTDGLSLFNYGYLCTNEIYDINQCNWSIEPFFDDGDGKIIVETAHGNDGAFNTTVSEVNNGITEIFLSASGKRGDVGNISMSFYSDGVISSTRTSTRSGTGFETVEHRFDDGSYWLYSENADCSGSADLTNIRDDETATLTANWAYVGERSHGQFVYTSTDLESSINFSW